MVHRMRLRVGLLLAGVLAAVAVSVPLSSIDTINPTAGLTAGISATNPASLSGRPVATPSVLCISSPANPMPFGVMPSVVPGSTLERLSLRQQRVPTTPYQARRPAEGDRAPPVGSWI